MEWNDDRYYHAVTAMLAILDEMERRPMKRHELAGVIVFAILQALEAWEVECAAQPSTGCPGHSRLVSREGAAAALIAASSAVEEPGAAGLPPLKPITEFQRP